MMLNMSETNRESAPDAARPRLPEELREQRKRSASQVQELRVDVSAELSAMRIERRKRGAAWRGRLGKQASRIRSGVATVREEVRREVNSWRSERAGVRKGLHDAMTTGRNSTRDEVARIRRETHELVKLFREQRRQSCRRLKSMLGDSKSTRCAQLGTLRADSRRRRRAVWKETSGELAGKRLGKTGNGDGSVREARDFEGLLLEAISNHPAGVSLSEIAGEMGTMPVVLSRAARNLLEKGRVRKEAKLYFPLE